MTAGARQAEDEAGQSLTHAQGRFRDALHELRGLIGSANSQFAQQRQMLIAGVIGAVLGFALWYPLVWLAPWGGGDWLAASLIGGGRWQAGEVLMQEEAAPASWERMARLYKACPKDTTTELCEAAMAVRNIPNGHERAPPPPIASGAHGKAE